MLTVAQAKVLCNRSLHVRFNGDRVVWWEDGSSYPDKQGRLLHAYSSDEAGEDWRVVPAATEKLTLVTAGPSYGGYFHVDTQVTGFGLAQQQRIERFSPPGQRQA